MGGVMGLYLLGGRGRYFWGVQFTWASGSFVMFWMDDLSLKYWWIALTKVWLSKARKKNAISHSNEVMSVFGGTNPYLTVNRKRWNNTISKRPDLCVCVCVYYIVIDLGETLKGVPQYTFSLLPLVIELLNSNGCMPILKKKNLHCKNVVTARWGSKWRWNIQFLDSVLKERRHVCSLQLIPPMCQWNAEVMAGTIAAILYMKWKEGIMEGRKNNTLGGPGWL